MFFMGMSRTSSFVVPERSDASESKVHIKNPAFLLVKKCISKIREITNSYKDVFSFCNELCYWDLHDLKWGGQGRSASVGETSFSSTLLSCTQPCSGFSSKNWGETQAINFEDLWKKIMSEESFSFTFCYMQIMINLVCLFGTFLIDIFAVVVEFTQDVWISDIIRIAPVGLSGGSGKISASGCPGFFQWRGNAEAMKITSSLSLEISHIWEVTKLWFWVDCLL